MIRTYLILTMLLAVALPALGAGESNAEKTDRLIAVLQSDAPFFDKARACQQLGEIGTAKAVPALAKLLDDERLAAYARSGLEGIPGPEGAEAMRNAIGRLKGLRLIGVVNSLGALRDAQAVDVLKALAADPASGAAGEALLALGRIANEAAIDTVRRALAENDAARRIQAASACRLAAEQQLAAGNADAAIGLYDAIRTADIPPINRAGATHGAILARRSKAVPFLIEQLRSGDALVRNEALLAVRSIPSEELATALSAELPKASSELQEQILWALADCRNAQSLEAIRKYAGAEDAGVRRAALAALTGIGNREAAAALLALVSTPHDAESLDLAVSGLQRLEDPAIDELTVKALMTATQTQSRVWLIRLLEGHVVTGAIPDLLKLAADKEPEVRVAALRALRAMAGEPELPALLALVRTASDDPTRSAAESAVVAVCKPLPDAGAGPVLGEFERATEPAVKCAWIRVLTSLGNAKALPAITAALKDADASVAAEAARQLGRWPDLAPLESVLAAAESANDAAQRARAVASAIQLLTVAAEKNQRPPETLAAMFARAAKSASTTAEKRALISGLARVPHDAGLRLLMEFYDDPALRQESAVAIVRISPVLIKQSPPPTLRKVLLSIAAGDAGQDVHAQAARLAGTLPQATELFDGRSLDGWKSDPKVWRVRDGVIVGGSLKGNPQNEFLVTQKTYGDFVLRLDYKLVGTEGFVNGGVQFRSVRVQQPANEMSGFQADIGAGHSGCLYDESRRNRFLMRATEEQIKRLEKPGDWNQCEVRCAGPHIQIVLNGEKTVDYIEPDPTIPRTGLIGLQIHGNCKAEISFRNITLEELSYGAANRFFGIGKSKWKVISFSSENTQVEDERAVLAIDDNPATFWHTQWSGGKPAHPHHLAVDLGERAEISGFTYLPRQDGRQGAGVIGEYEFYLSSDGKDWGQPVARGRFENIDRDPGGRVVLLDKPAAKRYFKIVSLSAPGSQPYAGAAEIGVLGMSGYDQASGGN